MFLERITNAYKIEAAIYICIFIYKVSFGAPGGFGFRTLRSFRAEACLTSRKAVICEKCRLELGPEPQMARNSRSSLARSRSWLEMAARLVQSRSWLAKWLLEPGPAPQLARNARSSVPRSRRVLDRCSSNLLQNREMLDWCPSSHRGSAECSMGAARACSGATACSKSAARAD